MTLDEDYRIYLCTTISMLLNQINIARCGRDLINITYVEKLKANIIIKCQESTTLEVNDLTLEKYTKELFLKGSRLLNINVEDESIIVKHGLKFEMIKSIQMILKQVTLGKEQNVEVKVEYIDHLNKVNILINNKEVRVDVNNLNTQELSTKVLSLGL